MSQIDFTSDEVSHPGLSTQRASAELQVHQRAKLMKIPAAMPLAEAAAFSVGAQTAYSIIRRLAPARGAHIAVTAASSNTSLFLIKALVARGHHPLRKNISLIGNNLGTTADLESALDDYCQGRLPVTLDSVHGGGDLANFVERSFVADNRLGKVVFDYGPAPRVDAECAAARQMEPAA